MALAFLLLQITLRLGGQQWTFSTPAESFTLFDVVHACCTVDANHDCSVKGKLTCEQLFALPDSALPVACEHRGRGLYWDHIICPGQYPRQ